MDHSEKAKELFMQGYNCSQAVFGAFCDEFGMDAKTALRVSAGLGGGVGRMREVCGAVSGMALVLSLKYGGYEPENKEAKAKLYSVIQQCANEFREQNGAIVCRELIKSSDTAPTPSERGAEFYKKRPCVELVGSAAGILEKFFAENE